MIKNARAKGRNNELRTRRALEADGWLVEVPNYTRYGNKDFYNAWDCMAVRNGEIRWVQTKSNKRPPPAYVLELAKFPGPGKKEIWIWIDRKKEPRILELEYALSGLVVRELETRTGPASGKSRAVSRKDVSRRRVRVGHRNDQPHP